MQPSAIPEVRQSAEEAFASGLFCAESVSSVSSAAAIVRFCWAAAI